MAGIWAVSGAVPVTAETVLPNVVVELIFNLGPPHRVVDGHGDDAVDRWYRRAWLAGMQQGPLTIASQGHTDLVGVRFRPGGAAAVFGLPLAAITDAVVELDQLDVADGSFGSLWERLLAADIDTRVALVTAALVRRARGHRIRRPPDARVAAAIVQLATAPSLAALAGVPPQFLRTRLAGEPHLDASHLLSADPG